MQIHTRRVVHDDLAIVGTKQRSEFVPDDERQFKPFTPRPNEARTPFFVHHLVKAMNSCSRQHAERVAVEVRQVGIIDDEPVAPMRKFIS